ncbi:MAG: tape measure protein [Steroidobacteraceae bacterium]|nr:tape measure protein [Deltaproteobacteria bacterium]
MALKDIELQVSVTGVDASARELDKLGLSVEKAGKKTTSVTEQMAAGWTRAQGALMGFGVGFSLVAVINELHQAGMAIERLNNSFAAATGSVKGGSEAMSFVRAESQRLGLDLKSAADGYMKLSAAAKGTALEGANTQALFRSVAGASTALGLSAEQSNGALLALSQMMSKGTVQAEELRGQLGERLPGSFQIAARAMGVSTSELGKMLEAGKVVAEDFLPKFAAELEKTFPPGEKAMSGLTAETNRLKTAWFELNATVMTSGGDNLFAGVIRGLKTATEWAERAARTVIALDNSPKLKPLSPFDKNLAGGITTPIGPSGGASYLLGDRDNIIAKEVQITGEVIKEVKKRKAAKAAANYTIDDPGFMNWKREQEMLKEESSYIKDQIKAMAEAAKQAVAEAAAAEQGYLAAVNNVWQQTKDHLAAVKTAKEEESAIMREALNLNTIARDAETSMIEDPYQRQKQSMLDRYEDERRQIKATTDARKASNAVQAGGTKALHSIEQQKIKETAAINKQSFTSRVAVLGDYAAIGSQLFAGMADAQDQSSRQGFESAKDYSMGAALMSTAAAVIGQLTGPDAWTPAAWVRAGAAGVLGGMQVLKIAGTSFGGGGSVSASVGSFGGGGGSAGSVGGSIGPQINSVRDSQTQDQLQRIADSMENASLAIGKVSDGLTKIADLFREGGLTALASGAAPNMGTAVSSMEGGLMQGLFGAKKGFKLDWETFGTQAIINNITSAVFGSDTWINTGAGVSLGLKGKALSASNYATQTQDGGWFGSDKSKTSYTPNEAFTASMQAALNSVIATITRGAVASGTSANFAGVNIDPLNIATAGRKSEDIQKDLEAWFTNASNTLAKTVDGLQAFAFYGENAFDALVRLSTALQSTNEGLELIGAGLIRSSLYGANAAFKLQDLMGGAEEFTSKIDTYFTSMFSDEEQAAQKAVQAARQVNTAFAEMGIDAPSDKAGFRGLVNSLDVTTASGAQTFAALMDVSEAFGSVQDYAQKAKESMDELLKNGFEYSTGLLTAAMDESARLLKEALSVAQSATSTLMGIKFGNTSPQQSYRDLKAAFQTATAGGDSAAILRLSTQFEAASRAYNASGTAYLADKSMIEKALLPLTGIEGTDPTLSELQTHTTALQNMDKNIGTQSGLMNTNNTRLADLNLLMGTYVKDSLAVTKANQGIYDSRVTGVSGTLAALNGAGSVTGLAGIINQMATGATANPFGFTGTMTTLAQNVASGSALPATLTSAINAQISTYFADYLKAGVVGANTSVGIPALLKTRDEEMFAKAAAIRTALEITREGGNYTPYNANWDIVGDKALKTLNSADFMAWVSIQNGSKKYSDYTTLPAFASGSPYIPYDMTANIHQGEIVMDRASSDVLRKYGIPTSGSADNKELIAEIKELRKEVIELKSHAKAAVVVQQAGFKGVIDVNERQDKRLQGVESAARLERAA